MTTPLAAGSRVTVRDYVTYAGLLVGLGFLSIFWIVMLCVSLSLVFVWVGIPLLDFTLRGIRSSSTVYRRASARINAAVPEQPYRELEGSFLERLRIRITDPTTYRDLLWLVFAISLGLAVGITSLVLYLLFPVGFWLSPMLLRVVAACSEAILRRADSEAMALRIGQLTRTRAETVDTQAAELRRIERDLHDGAQARLVALSMNLGLAEQLMGRDPEASKQLISDSRQSAGIALSDLRDLVRGIHPPVLADRGLLGGVHALALAHPVPIEVDVDIDGRPPEPVESAVYFAIAEILANSAKHSLATAVTVWMRHDIGVLRAAVGDNGIGGATLDEGGGLYGVQRRLAAFDGTVAVDSPAGGPTIVSLDVPCALTSKPKPDQEAAAAPVD